MRIRDLMRQGGQMRDYLPEIDPKARPLTEAGYLERGGMAERGFDPNWSAANAMYPEGMGSFKPQVDYVPAPIVAALMGGDAAKGIGKAIAEPTTENVLPVAVDWGVLGGAGSVARKGLKMDPTELNMGIRAYHGSPHDFDKFSMDKIGTGEGAQAYGHGLYFAEAEDVARGYRDTITKNQARDSGSSPRTAIAEAFSQSDLADVSEIDRTFLRGVAESVRDDDAALAARILDMTPEQARSELGHMYEVNINADPADFLDWDAPLSEQPANVQEIARNMDTSGLSSRQRGKIEKWKAGTANELEVPTGNELHSMLTDFGTDSARNADLTARLTSQGIPGIRYKDAGSRGADGGTSNYVVFDDSLIEILRKYGMAGALPLGAILGANEQQQ